MGRRRSHIGYYNLKETKERISKVQELLKERNLQAALIYYNAANIANEWYITGWFPQFEDGILLIPVTGEAMILGGAESEEFAHIDSAVKETRNFSLFMQPGLESFHSKMYDFHALLRELSEKGIQLKRIGVVGLNSMPSGLYKVFMEEFKECKVENITTGFEKLRLVKSEWERACIKQAGRLAEEAYFEMLGVIKSGVYEYEVAAAGESVARTRGASGFGFSTIIASGERINAIVPTASNVKRLKDKEMIIMGIAPQWNGYTGTVGDTVPVNGTYTDEQRSLMNHLREAFRLCRDALKPGRTVAQVDQPGMDYLRRKGYGEHLVCQFTHSTGLMECEGVYYLNPNSDTVLEPGMAVNLDVSLFGLPTYYGARLEAGYFVTEKGVEPISEKFDELFTAEI